MSRALLTALILSGLSSTPHAANLRLINAADVPLARVHAVPDGQPGDGPDHLDGQAGAPGEEIRLDVPDDACRLRLRLVWIDGASADTVHDICAAVLPLAIRAP